jgi:hypothetical protein
MQPSQQQGPLLAAKTATPRRVPCFQAAGEDRPPPRASAYGLSPGLGSAGPLGRWEVGTALLHHFDAPVQCAREVVRRPSASRLAAPLPDHPVDRLLERATLIHLLEEALVAAAAERGA